MLKSSERCPEEELEMQEDSVVFGEKEEELDEASSKAISMLHSRLGEERAAR